MFSDRKQSGNANQFNSLPSIFTRMSQDQGFALLQQQSPVSKAHPISWLLRESSVNGMLTVDYMVHINGQTFKDSKRLAFVPEDKSQAAGWTVVPGEKIDEIQKIMRNIKPGQISDQKYVEQLFSEALPTMNIDIHQLDKEQKNITTKVPYTLDPACMVVPTDRQLASRNNNYCLYSLASLLPVQHVQPVQDVLIVQEIALVGCDTDLKNEYQSALMGKTVSSPKFGNKSLDDKKFANNNGVFQDILIFDVKIVELKSSEENTRLQIKIWSKLSPIPVQLNAKLMQVNAIALCPKDIDELIALKNKYISNPQLAEKVCILSADDQIIKSAIELGLTVYNPYDGIKVLKQIVPPSYAEAIQKPPSFESSQQKEGDKKEDDEIPPPSYQM